MEKVKLIFLQTMIISFGIQCSIAISAVLYHIGEGGDLELCWYHPISIILCGFLCALPSLLFYSAYKMSKRWFRVCAVLHFLFVFAVVMGAGYVFRWYTHRQGAVVVAIDYIVIYFFVWGVTYWVGIVEQKKMNKALDDIRDEE